MGKGNERKRTKSWFFKDVVVKYYNAFKTHRIYGLRNVSANSTHVAQKHTIYTVGRTSRHVSAIKRLKSANHKIAEKYGRFFILVSAENLATEKHTTVARPIMTIGQARRENGF